MSDSNLRIFREKLLLENQKQRGNLKKKKKKNGKRTNKHKRKDKKN